MEQPRVEDLLDPISEDQPGGANLRHTPEWGQIKEARRSDDPHDAGQWAKKDRKFADWRLLEELTFEALRTKTKDLQLAIWFTEAGVKLRGFTGLSEGLRLLKELTARYWDKGLFPLIEDGPEDRAKPFEWLNEKLAESILDLPITRRSDRGEDFSFAKLRAARGVGSESSFTSKDGEIDEGKKKAYTEALASVGVSMDMYIAALSNSPLDEYKQLTAEVEEVHQQFKTMEQVTDEKFDEKYAPNLSNLRGILREIKQEVSDRLEKKIKESQPALLPGLGGEAGNGSGAGLSLSFIGSGSATGVNGSWQEAEQLIRSGKIDAGLSVMTRLAASETTGRNRFQRKLLLAEICLASRRKELARAILEELAEQVDKFKLSEWESSDLVGGVWSRLYKIYKQNENDKDLAKDLFEKLCRLDPWQALYCGD